VSRRKTSYNQTYILEVLTGQKYRYLRFISSLLDKLCGENTDDVQIFPQPTRFRPRDAELPRGPAVYLIVSIEKTFFEYIGESSNLARRLNEHEHNSLQGPPATAHLDHLPYALHAYVVGFADNGERLRFESEWKLTVNNIRRQHISLNIKGRVFVALEMITEANEEKQRLGLPPLRLVQCDSIDTTIS